MSIEAGNDRVVAGQRERSQRLHLAPWLSLGLVMVALPSCTANPARVNPPVGVPEAFSVTGDVTMPERWWTSFGDAKLDSLLQEALRENFSLRVAWDRLDQARAVAARRGASLWPSLDGGAGASRTATHMDAGGTGPAGARGGRTYTTDFSLSLVASYEVDLWGNVRSTYDAAVLDVSATQQDLQSAAITLAADIARTWFRLVEQGGQLRLLAEQIATNEKYLEAITLRFRRGQIGATDVLQQRQLIESTKGERILVESGIKVLEHQLAVLVGRAPGNLDATVPPALPPLPPLPQAGLPAEWIRRRPDVQAAEIRVRAADQRVAAAIADQFPKLSLTLNTSTTAERVRDLFDNWMASIAANLVAPLFDGGERRAEVERTRAVVSERLNSYGQVALTSLQEVEDALSQEAKQAEYVKSLHDQLDLSRKAKGQTLENYTKGTADFTRYLTTLLSHQRLQRSRLQAQRDLVLFRIDLYRALAGGWELPRPPQARIPTSKR